MSIPPYKNIGYLRPILIDVCNEKLEEGAEGQLRDNLLAIRDCLWNHAVPNELLNPELYYFYMHFYKTVYEFTYGEIAWG